MYDINNKSICLDFCIVYIFVVCDLQQLKTRTMEVFSPSVAPQGQQGQENAGNPPPSISSSSTSNLNGPSGSGSLLNSTTTSASSSTSTAAAFAAAIDSKKPPSWQLDLTMEKLRQKANQLKPLSEISKNIRMTLAVI